MRDLEETLWTALNEALDRLSDAEVKLNAQLFTETPQQSPPDELANLRADLEAACRERDAAQEREGELQRRIHNLQVGVDSYRMELDEVRPKLRNLRANCDLFQRERDQAVAELHKLRASIERRPVDSTPNTC